MFRALALVVLTIGLAACGDRSDRAPFAESRVPPSLAGRFFPPEGWAWGYVQSGAAPPLRYGVAAPRGVPRAQLLIVVGAGETAEAWFETVRQLNEAGFTVWVLERAGQAGSGRFASPRELVHAPSLDPDINAVKAMARLIIRAGPGSCLVLMAERDAAPVVLAALDRHVEAGGLILSSPEFSPPGAAETPGEAFLRRLGLAQAKPVGWRPWSRDQPQDEAADPWRGGVQHAWQAANPDLRMSGESIGWRQALREAGAAARRRAPSIAVPTLMIVGRPPSRQAAEVCKAMPRCRRVTVDGAPPAFHLEPDRRRKPWLDAIAAFVGG